MEVTPWEPGQLRKCPNCAGQLSIAAPGAEIRQKHCKRALPESGRFSTKFGKS